MDELVQWLGAQLDEDVRIARAVEDRSAPFDGQWMADGDSAVRTLNGHVLFYRHDSAPLKPGLADHVAEHDPARVLREIDAKRQILAEYEQAARYAKTTWGQSNADQSRARTLGKVLRLLALPYSARPGYAEAVAAFG